MGTQVAQAVAKLKKRLVGKCCYGLPHHELANKLELRLVEVGDVGLFDKHDVKTTDWLPLAAFKGEEDFLLIAHEAPHRVGVWNHGSGIIPVWESLDLFAKKLVDKKHKTPFDKLDRTLE